MISLEEGGWWLPGSTRRFYTEGGGPPTMGSKYIWGSFYSNRPPYFIIYNVVRLIVILRPFRFLLLPPNCGPLIHLL